MPCPNIKCYVIGNNGLNKRSKNVLQLHLLRNLNSPVNRRVVSIVNQRIVKSAHIILEQRTLTKYYVIQNNMLLKIKEIFCKQNVLVSALHNLNSTVKS